MVYTRKNKGVCSSYTTVEIVDGIVKKLTVNDGCQGNLSGISALCEGMPVDDVVKRLQGIRCGFKPTSCPDQIAKTLLEAQAQEKQA